MRDAPAATAISALTFRDQSDLMARYLASAPLPLAVERTVECRLYPRFRFERPVLDIGCGEGLFAHMLFAEPIDTGIDPNPRELERARELGAYAELIECYGDAVPKPSESYRTILSNSVLEHIEKLEPVLREAHRLLTPDGRFYFTAPSDRFDHFTVGNQALTLAGLSGLAARYRRFYDGFWRHYHYYSLEGWQQLVERCGFRVVESFAYEPKDVCLLNDALVPLSLPGFLVKRLTNRWVLLPSLRRVLTQPVSRILTKVTRGAERAEDGGLVFMALAKAAES